MFFELAKEHFIRLTKRNFLSMFGFAENGVEFIWNSLDDKENILPINLLQTLHFLKNHPTYDEGALIWNCSRQTYYKKIWKIIDDLRNLNLIPFANPDQVFIVDTTACKIPRPASQQKIYYSGKHHYHCVKYQFIVLKSGLIVDVDGPYPGSYHDFKIYKNSKIVVKLLNLNAFVIG